MVHALDCRYRRLLTAVLLPGFIGGSPLVAQMPGVPVLQNAFTSPGLTAAGNLGSGSSGSTFGGAAAYTPGSGRLQLSGGMGLYTPKNGNGRFGWGARASVSLLSTAGGKLGVGAFAGIGGAGSGRSTVASAADSINASAVTLVPVGASLGYRRSIGGTRSVSLYGSPVFTWYNKGGKGAGTGTVVRVSVGTDVGLSQSIGLTLGAEFGGNAEAGTLGPRGTLFGAGLSLVFGRN